MGARVPVLVVGGGPIGLSAAIELARFGVATLVLEKHSSTTRHPKARNLNSRTLEITRTWGGPVHDELRAVALPRDWTTQIVYTETLGGREFGRMPTQGFYGFGEDVSPDIPVLQAQDVYEPILVRGLEAAGCSELRFGQRVVCLRQDETTVEVDVVDTGSGEEYTVAAEWVIAADGAASGVRSTVGGRMEGPTAIGHNINVYFEADLLPWVRNRPAIMYWVANSHARGVFQPLDGRRRWLCQIKFDPATRPAEAWSAERCIEWIRSAVGSDDLDVDVLSIGAWTMNATVADRFRFGRVLLAGDAAHQLPPTGGFGVNSGIIGIHNLAWKLAYVLDGSATSDLLDTYDAEHRPMARFNADRSLDNSTYVGRVAAAGAGTIAMSPEDAVLAARRYGNFAGMELGYSYDSPGIVPDCTPPPSVIDPVQHYAPSARPGHRAPHLWLGDDANRHSILDLFGTRFTLVAAVDGECWRSVSHPQVDVVHIGTAPNTDRGGLFSSVYAVGTAGAVLVRPDGHVAYRARAAVADPQSEIDRAMRQVLGFTHHRQPASAVSTKET